MGSLVVFWGLGEDDEEESEESEEPGEGHEMVPLNDLWVLSPVSPRESLDGGGVEGASRPVWSLVVLDGVGPSSCSLAALIPRLCGGDGEGSWQ